MPSPMGMGGLTYFIRQMQGGQNEPGMNPQKHQDQNLQKILLGLQDSRGSMGQAARGTNVYRGATGAPNTGISFGDLSKDSMQRRLQMTRAKAQGKPVVADMPRGGF